MLQTLTPKMLLTKQVCLITGKMRSDQCTPEQVKQAVKDTEGHLKQVCVNLARGVTLQKLKLLVQVESESWVGQTIHFLLQISLNSSDLRKTPILL